MSLIAHRMEGAVGDRIKDLRKLRGMTQGDLAVKVGTSKQNISRYENGVVENIPRKQLELIAYALDTSYEYLVTGYDSSFDDIEDYDVNGNRINVSSSEVDEMREELRANPDLRMLLSASRNLNAEDIRQLVALAERMNRE